MGWSRSEGVRGSDKEKYYIIGPKAQEMGRSPTQQPSAGARMQGPKDPDILVIYLVY